MKNFVTQLLNDPFGVSNENLTILLDMIEDEDGSAAADEIEEDIETVEIDGYTRNRIW